MTVVRKRLQGGSTIEQQFVRRVTGDSRVSIKRKAKEWLLAIEVARLSRKKETVARYLQLAYFGPDCIGLFEASARLVGTHPDNLNLRQAAFLAARLKYPEVPAPAARRVRMVACRTNYILLSVIKEFKRSSIQGLTSVLSPEELAELEAGIGEAQRGEMISGEEFFQQLRRHG